MFELDDCGKEFHLTFGWYVEDPRDVTVQMVIKAPRGTMVLFDQKHISPDSQCEAIKEFMRQHRDD